MVLEERGLNLIRQSLAMPAILSVASIAMPAMFLEILPLPQSLHVPWQAVGLRRLIKALSAKSAPQHPVFMVSISSWGKIPLLFSF